MLWSYSSPHVLAATAGLFLSTYASQALGQPGAEVPVPFRLVSQDAGNHLHQSQVFWSADQVQAAIAAVTNLPFYRRQPNLSAYLRVYQAMTARRDHERIRDNGRLRPESLFNERLNDGLADLMTKNYLRQMFAFASQNEKVGDQLARAELNEVLYYQTSPLFVFMQDARGGKYDAGAVVLDSTYYYLSTNIAFAISALPHWDQLWGDRPERTLDERIATLERYAADFRKFDMFLVDNTATVIDVLTGMGDTLGYVLAVPAVSAFSPLAYLPISLVRARAFSTGIELARRFTKNQHPYLMQTQWWPRPDFAVDFDSVNVNESAFLR